MGNLPKGVKRYIGFLSLLSIALLSYLFIKYDIPSFNILIFWSLLAVVTESLRILLPSGVGVSVGFAISLSALVLGGPLLSALVTGIGFIFRVTDDGNKKNHIFNTPVSKTIFNSIQSIISAGIAGIAYVMIGGKINSEVFHFSFIAVILTVFVYILLNTIMIAKLFSLLTNKTFIDIWMDSIKGTLLNSFAVGSLGIIIALAYIGYGYGAVLLFFGPLLLARYSFKMYMDTKTVYMETVEALNRSMEAKDAYTSGHAGRVGEYAIKLAQELNLSGKKIENIKTASVLHDIGKIGINDSILKKPGKLSDEEFKEIKKHPVIGAQIIKDVAFLKDAVKIVKSHHERYDGFGYPEGLKGDEIPVEAAVLSISDVYDAMTSERPYRGALTIEEALREIEKNAGTQLHPEYAKVFINLIRKEQEKEKTAHAN